MTSPVLERTRFPRLLASEDARALNLKGAELGRISQANSDGVFIECSSDAIADRLVEEGELRIVIVEPRSQASSSVDVVVRHREGRQVCLEYVESI
jgi:hypothetical protein